MAKCRPLVGQLYFKCSPNVCKVPDQSVQRWTTFPSPPTTAGDRARGGKAHGEVLIGHPSYEVTGGTVNYHGEDVFELEAEERAQQVSYSQE